MKTYSIVAKEDQLSQTLALHVRGRLIHTTWSEDRDHPELVIVIGGDGAMLRAIHHYMDQLDRTAFVGLHTGTLGFYTDYDAAEIDQFINELLTNTMTIEGQSLVEAVFEHSDQVPLLALNEIRFENPMRTLEADVYIDGQLLERFKGNGLNISTPSGSTAYNKSLGGAVIMAPLEAIQLMEIAPIRHNKYASLQSPLILGKDHHIELVIHEWQGTVVGYDHLTCSMQGPNKVHLRLASQRVRFARFRNYPFIKRLQKAFILSQ